jgi:hypothetical protein
MSPIRGSHKKKVMKALKNNLRVKKKNNEEKGSAI